MPSSKSKPYLAVTQEWTADLQDSTADVHGMFSPPGRNAQPNARRKWPLAEALKKERRLK